MKKELQQRYKTPPPRPWYRSQGGTAAARGIHRLHTRTYSPLSQYPTKKYKKNEKEGKKKKKEKTGKKKKN